MARARLKRDECECETPMPMQRGVLCKRCLGNVRDDKETKRNEYEREKARAIREVLEVLNGASEFHTQRRNAFALARKYNLTAIDLLETLT